MKRAPVQLVLVLRVHGTFTDSACKQIIQLIDIAAGDQHTCGIDIEGKAVCWGATGINANGGPDSTQLFGSFNQLDATS